MKNGLLCIDWIVKHLELFFVDRAMMLDWDLSRSLADRVLQKEYLFITKAIPEKESFVEYGPLGDLVESEIRIKKWVVEDGLPSETRFKLMKLEVNIA